MQTKTVKLITNAGGGVSLAHPAMHPGDYTDQGAFVVAIERVPTLLCPPGCLVAPLPAPHDPAGDARYGGRYRLHLDCTLTAP